MEFSRKALLSLCFAVFFRGASGNCTVKNSIELFCKKLSDGTLAPAAGEALVTNATKGSDVKVTEFRLSDFDSTVLGPDCTGGLFFKKFTIISSPKLEIIHPLAFQASAEFATEIHVIESLNLGNRAIAAAESLPLVKVLRLKRVGLKEVLAGAFDKNMCLSQILLPRNGITSFSAPLAGRDLDILDLSDNKLNVDSIPNNVFTGMKKLKRLHLYNNEQMKILRRDVFELVLASGTIIKVGWEDPKSKNPYMTCLGQEWLCKQVVWRATYVNIRENVGLSPPTATLFFHKNDLSS